MIKTGLWRLFTFIHKLEMEVDVIGGKALDLELVPICFFPMFLLTGVSRDDHFAHIPVSCLVNKSYKQRVGQWLMSQGKDVNFH